MLNRFLPILAALSLLACGPKTGRAPLSDEALLDTVERYTVKYFTDFADPATGLARERNNDRNGNIVTIGGPGPTGTMPTAGTRSVSANTMTAGTWLRRPSWSRGC